MSFYNPSLSPNLDYREMQDIDVLFNNFFRQEAKKESVFLLLGGSGSGKSTAFQLKYLNLLFKIQANDPIPLYMNLATSLSVEEQWNNINDLIKRLKPMFKPIHFSNFSGANKYPMVLFLDSFDESTQKCNLVIRFLKELGNNPKNKVLINCRSDYLQNNNEDEWFRAGPEKENEFMKIYILPLDQYDYGLEAYVKKFIRINKIQSSVNEYMKKIQMLNFKEIMQTCYMVYLALTVLPDFSEEKNLNKMLIYQKYTEKSKMNEIKKIAPNFMKKIIMEFDVLEADLMGFFEKVAENIARSLHLLGNSRINQKNGEIFFEKLKFTKENFFKNQSLFNLAKVLDLNMEITGDIPHENIVLGFSHETIKNYYLIKMIINEALNGETSILSEKLVVDDETLLRFLAEVVAINDKLISFFKKIIYITKTDKKIRTIF